MWGACDVATQSSAVGLWNCDSPAPANKTLEIIATVYSYPDWMTETTKCNNTIYCVSNRLQTISGNK